MVPSLEAELMYSTVCLMLSDPSLHDTMALRWRGGAAATDAATKNSARARDARARSEQEEWKSGNSSRFRQLKERTTMTAPSNTVCRLLGRPRVPRRRKTGPTCHKLTKHGLIRRSVVFAKQLRETWCFLQRFCILVFFANLALKVVVLCNLLHVSSTDLGIACTIYIPSTSTYGSKSSNTISA